MTIKLVEQIDNGVKARIRIISSGIGSSGFYSAEVLERDGATAFPAGTHLFYNHITESEEWDRKGSRDIKDLVGKTLTDAEYIPDTESLEADVLIYNSSADKVTEFFEDIGLSIEASGKKDSETGEVQELLYSPHNAIALVPRAGRDGKIIQFLESLSTPDNVLIESGTIETIENSPEKDTQEMTPEDIEKLAEAIAKSLAPAFSDLKESLTPKEPEHKEPDTTVADVVEALVTADLPKELRARVLESEKPLDTLNDIKAIRESLASSSAVEPVGRVQESGAKSESFISTAWSNA